MNNPVGQGTFDYQSPQHWDRVIDSSRNPDFSHNEALVRSMVDAVEGVPGARLLDVATGDGRLAIVASARGARALGIDISTAALRLAEQQTASCPAGGAPTFLLVDAMSTGLPSDGFSVVTCLRSLWVLPDPQRCLREIYRVLAPGGQLVIQLWGPPRTCRMLSLGAAILGKKIPGLRLPEGQTGPFDYTPERLEDELRLAGFALERTTWHGVDVRAASPAQYWRKFGSVAGTAHAALIEQPEQMRTEIDAELLARTRSFLDEDGELLLPLTWAVCSARKQVCTAGANS